MQNEPNSHRKSYGSPCRPAKSRTQPDPGNPRLRLRAGVGGRHRTATRDGLLSKTCLPTISIIHVARALVVKRFGYNEKSCEMGFGKEGFSAGLQTAVGAHA